MFTLVLGGSKSGKSGFAENYLIEKNLSRNYYLATMKPVGKEAEQAVRRHQQMREGKGFITIEKTMEIADWEEDLLKNSGVLLECIGNLCANEMFRETEVLYEVAEKIVSDVLQLRGKTKELVVVSNIVDEDGICYSRETTAYINNMGLINQKLAEQADCVVEMVCGIPLLLKGDRW